VSTRRSYRARPGAYRVSTRSRPRDLEHQEQARFIAGIRHLAHIDKRYAEAVDRTYAIPNGGGRSKAQAGKLKAEGVRKGVCDLFISLPRGTFHGCYIEMKSETGTPTKEQKQWIADSLRLGYYARVCKGQAAAFEIWKTYVDGGALP
jgi:hypothetical protein